MRMKAAFVALLALCSSAAVRAEPPVGSRLGERLRTEKRSDIRTATLSGHALALCIAMQRTKQAKLFLDAVDAGVQARLEKLVFEEIECSYGATPLTEKTVVDWTGVLARGNLAEALVKNELKTVSIPAQPAQKSYPRVWYTATGRDVAVDEMSVCSLEVNPEGVFAILRTKPETREENTALGALTPTLGQCLQVGAKLTANRQNIRGALAEALFHKLNPVAPDSSEPAK